MVVEDSRDHVRGLHSADFGTARHRGLAARLPALLTAPGGCCCPPQAGTCGAAPAPTRDFGFGLCLVTAQADQDGLTGAEPLDAGT
jgi:hypothetical protein